jgi:hypothetical protein
MTTDKEKQHYIPKFFLRRFSCFSDGKTIGIFQPKNGRFVARGPLRSQAYRRYFYGKDGILEDRLSQVEGISAENLRQISALNQQFLPGTLQHISSLFHLLLSDMRTAAHVERLQGQMAIARDKAFEGMKKLPREFNRLVLSQEMAIQFAMEFMQDAMELCQDLEIRIVKNNTSIPFITCDNPALRYNQLLEKYKEPGGITGNAHAGLQLLMPIDARTMLIAYDGDYYKMGARTNARLSFCNERDVEQINVLSYLNCHSILFFNHEITEDYLIQLGQRAARFPAANQSIATKFYKVGVRGHETVYTATEPADYSSYIMHTYATSLKTRLSLSFMQFTRNFRYFVPHRTLANMRPNCAQIYFRNRQTAPERTSVKFTYDEDEKIELTSTLALPRLE